MCTDKKNPDKINSEYRLRVSVLNILKYSIIYLGSKDKKGW